MSHRTRNKPNLNNASDLVILNRMYFMVGSDIYILRNVFLLNGLYHIEIHLLSFRIDKFSMVNWQAQLRNYEYKIDMESLLLVANKLKNRNWFVISDAQIDY